MKGADRKRPQRGKAVDTSPMGRNHPSLVKGYSEEKGRSEKEEERRDEWRCLLEDTPGKTTNILQIRDGGLHRHRP